MKNILMILRAWLDAANDRDCPPDPLSRLTPRHLADLPVWHPRRDEDCCGR